MENPEESAARSPCRAEATRALRRLANLLALMPDDLPMPEGIDIHEDGEVCVEWCGPADRLVTLSINSLGRVNWIGRVSEITQEHEFIFEYDVPNDLASSVREVMSEPRAGISDLKQWDRLIWEYPHPFTGEPEARVIIFHEFVNPLLARCEMRDIDNPKNFCYLNIKTSELHRP